MPHGDVDTNVPSNECVKIDDEDEIVEVKKSGGSSKRTAQDILANKEVLVFESDNDEDDDDNNDIKDVNDSYEDDAVISKDKYMRQKTLGVKTVPAVETTTVTTNGLPKAVEASMASVSQEPEKPYQPQVIKYETPDGEKKGKQNGKVVEFGSSSFLFD